jgi:hypothetical protein
MDPEAAKDRNKHNPKGKMDLEVPRAKHKPKSKAKDKEVGFQLSSKISFFNSMPFNRV